MVRRAQKDELAQFAAPGVASLFPVAAGAACDEAAHAVSDDDRASRAGAKARPLAEMCRPEL